MASRSSHGRAVSRCWNVTVKSPLTESYLGRAAHDSWGRCSSRDGSYSQRSNVDLSARYVSEPTAVETLGVFNASARHLLDDLRRRTPLNSGEARDQLPVPEDLGIGAALQCCPTAWQFASRWQHGLMIVPTFHLAFNFLNSLGIIFVQCLRNNNNNEHL